MKTVVITGSSKGFGFAMLKEFRKRDFNCIISDIREDELKSAEENLKKINGRGEVLSLYIDVTDGNTVKALIEKVVSKFGKIDIWINNAGVNQPDNYIWDIDDNTINRLIDINLKGDIICSKIICKYMKKWGSGAIYFTEGFGYDGNARSKLTLYGSSKRGVNFFIDSLAKEFEDTNTNILAGHIIPGIMITNFIHKSLGSGKTIEIPEKTKLVYNVLGDYPETIAEYLVPKIIDNKKQNAHFVWLSNFRAARKAIKGFVFGKHPDYFKDK